MPTGYMPGDANSDSMVNIADVVFLINYLFVGGPTPTVMYAADVNTDCTIDVADVAYLINYLFCGGPPPIHRCNCPDNLGKIVKPKEGVVIDAT